MVTDQELLDRYTARGDDAAFAELVGRHLPHVFAAALRQTRDHALAEDVAQVVFQDLARKARSLKAGVVLAAWLHRATRFAAADALRRRARQAERERKAFTMDSLDRQHPEPPWEEIQPWLDAALDELPTSDREVLCSRFLEQRSIAELAAALVITPEAARKRVDRALDRLRLVLGRRGVHTTAAALGNAVLAHAVPPLPPALAGFATSVAAASTAGSTWTLPVLMTTQPLKSAAILAGAALLVGLPILHQESAIAQMRIAAQHPQTTPPTIAVAGKSVPTPAASNDFALEIASLDAGNARLRQELQELGARLQSLGGAAPPGAELLGSRQSIAALVDSGLATPEDAFRTAIVAMRSGDTNRLAQTWIWPEDTQRELLQVHLRAASEAKPRGLAADLRSGAVSELVFHRVEDADQGDRWLVYQLILSDGRSGPPYRVRMRAGDGVWRVVLNRLADIDQSPVDP